MSQFTRKLDSILEDLDLSVRDIGTTRDMGSTDPSDDGSYEKLDHGNLDTFHGAAHAVVHGSLVRSIRRGLVSSQLVDHMFERSLANQGSPMAAIEHLCFSPVGRDDFDGARLEVDNGKLIGYNGYEGEQIVADISSSDPRTAFVRVGSFVMSGMTKSLAERLQPKQ